MGWIRTIVAHGAARDDTAGFARGAGPSNSQSNCDNSGFELPCFLSSGPSGNREKAVTSGSGGMFLWR